MNNFKITGLNAEDFSCLFELTDAELKQQGAQRMLVNAKPGFPCRISLQDAELGEVIILLKYSHHRVHSPYAASGPIFIRKQVKTAQLAINQTPKMLHHRLLSLRAYSQEGIMIDAQTIDGNSLDATIHTCFDNQEIDYIHIHNASPGCYNCLVERV